MIRLAAIDPGPAESAYCVITEDCRPLQFGKLRNIELLSEISRGLLRSDRCVIEMVASYGMPVGAEVFETCVWIGRFAQAVWYAEVYAELIPRKPVKLHFCGSVRAKDANITQALVDRFAPGEPNHGKGSKAKPGFFYGFKADVWAAYALAVYAIDTQETAA